MLLIFIDECGDAKYKDYFALSVATINSNFYKKIKDGLKYFYYLLLLLEFMLYGLELL